jgi:hypothetical protein
MSTACLQILHQPIGDDKLQYLILSARSLRLLERVSQNIYLSCGECSDGFEFP